MIPSLGRWWYVAFLKEIPTAPGVYVVSVDGRPVYIGSSSNLRSRIGSYGLFDSRIGRSTVFSRLRGIDPVRIDVRISESRRRGDWLAREFRLIQRLNPDFNRNYRTGAAA